MFKIVCKFLNNVIGEIPYYDRPIFFRAIKASVRVTLSDSFRSLASLSNFTHLRNLYEKSLDYRGDLQACGPVVSPGYMAESQLLAEARFRSSARRIRFVLRSWVKCFLKLILFQKTWKPAKMRISEMVIHPWFTWGDLSGISRILQSYMFIGGQVDSPR